MKQMTIAVFCVVLALGCSSRDSATPPLDPDSSDVAAVTTTTPVADDVAVGQRAIDALLAEFGDERIATAAVLLAADQGYGLAQIIDAGAAGRLAGDGRITDPEGAIVAPDGPAAALLVDDLADIRVESARQRTSSLTWPVSELVERLEEAHPDRGSLLAVLALLDAGYSAEQITLALMTDGMARFDGAVVAYQLLDAEGRVVTPDGPLIGLMISAWLDGDRSTSTTTPPGEASATDTTDQLTVLMREASGEYQLTDDLLATLRSWGGVVVGIPEGTATITQDGQVSGWFAYRVTTVDAEVECWWSLDVEFPPASLELLDDGLVFSTTAVMDERGSCGDFGEFEMPLTGYVDVDLGLITVPMAEEYDVLFQR